MPRTRQSSVTSDRVLRNGNAHRAEPSEVNNCAAKSSNVNDLKAIKRRNVPEELPLKLKKKAITNNSEPDSLGATNVITSETTLAEGELKASTSQTTGAAVDVSSGGESFAVLLSQGLTSGDNEKIDAVLSNGDLKIITNTLDDLNASQVIPLIKAIDYRCRSRKRFSGYWLRWLHCVLSRHMSYLCSVNNIKNELSPLFEWMEKRTANMGDLLAVSGKLALINEQNLRRICPQNYILQQPTIAFEDDGDASTENSGSISSDDDSDSEDGVQDWWEDDELVTDSDADIPGDQESGSEEGEDQDEMNANDDDEKMEVL